MNLDLGVAGRGFVLDLAFDDDCCRERCRCLNVFIIGVKFRMLIAA